MKSTWHLWLSLAAISLIAADKPTTQSIDLGDFTIAIPSSWERLQDAATILTVRSPKESPADTFLDNVRLMAYELPREASLDSVFATQISPSATKGFRVIGQGGLSGGHQRILWMAIVPQDTSQERDALAKIDYLMVHGRKLYVAHCMVLADKFEQHRPRFDEIVRSLTFKGSPEVVNEQKPAPILPANRDAYENGRQIGRITFYILAAVVVLYGIFALIRRTRQ